MCKNDLVGGVVHVFLHLLKCTCAVFPQVYSFCKLLILPSILSSCLSSQRFLDISVYCLCGSLSVHVWRSLRSVVCITTFGLEMDTQHPKHIVQATTVMEVLS